MSAGRWDLDEPLISCRFLTSLLPLPSSAPLRVTTETSSQTVLLGCAAHFSAVHGRHSCPCHRQHRTRSQRHIQLHLDGCYPAKVRGVPCHKRPIVTFISSTCRALQRPPIEPAMYVGCSAGRHLPNCAAPDLHRQQRPSRCLDIISPPGHNRSIANHCSKYKTAITGHLALPRSATPEVTTEALSRTIVQGWDCRLLDSSLAASSSLYRQPISESCMHLPSSGREPTRVCSRQR